MSLAEISRERGETFRIQRPKEPLNFPPALRPSDRGIDQLETQVCRDLIEMGIATIVLNVRDDNHPAVRVYERLGFERYCTYFEVPARRVE